jgi:hypothetical protein
MEDDSDCAGECNYIVRTETTTRPDGSTLREAVETCTGCGRVISREPLPNPAAD